MHAHISIKEFILFFISICLFLLFLNAVDDIDDINICYRAHMLFLHECYTAEGNDFHSFYILFHSLPVFGKFQHDSGILLSAVHNESGKKLSNWKSVAHSSFLNNKKQQKRVLSTNCVYVAISLLWLLVRKRRHGTHYTQYSIEMHFLFGIGKDRRTFCTIHFSTQTL